MRYQEQSCWLQNVKPNFTISNLGEVVYNNCRFPARAAAADIRQPTGPCTSKNHMHSETSRKDIP
uniref:Uncharacterized protein n=1 Tax=Salix viminalis TaxID=40686 RepID=A0A6N2N3K6_SALVM